MRRFTFALDLIDDENLISEYENRHKPENTWPAINKSILDAGIIDMEIYRVGNRLFMIMETDDSFSFERKSIMDATNVHVQKWEQEMWKYQQTIPWTTHGEKWVLMKQIYKLAAD